MIKFTQFLQAAYDIFKPKKNKRLNDVDSEKTIKPYLDKRIKHYQDMGYTGKETSNPLNAPNIASTAWFDFKKEKNKNG